MGAEASAAQTAQQPAAQTAQQLEESRVKAIRTLCKANNLDDRFAREWVTRGMSIEIVADEILKVMEERGKVAAESPAALGMEKKDVQRWSLHRAIQALESQDWTKAGLELATSQAVQQKTGRAPSTGRSILVPIDVLARPMTPSEEFAALMQRAGRRDLTVASLSGGGYLVDTQNQGFIDMLRNSTVCYPMGARRLSGLQGNVTIPKRTAGATGYWLASESTAITESGQTFGQLSLSPKTVGAYNEISRLLVMQSSPDAEAITMSGLALDVGLAMDLGSLTGSGSGGQPTGLLNISGIGSVADATVDYGDVIEFQTDVAAANALSGASSAGYVMAPTTAGLLKQRVKFANTASPLWEGRLDRGQVDGYPAMSSNQLSAQIIFGDWSQMIIAEWGVLEIALNPAANFPAGIVGVRAMYTVDVGLRYAAAFSAMATAS
jgi:HK97 family phage major capsid protein